MDHIHPRKRGADSPVDRQEARGKNTIRMTPTDAQFPLPLARSSSTAAPAPSAGHTPTGEHLLGALRRRAADSASPSATDTPRPGRTATASVIRRNVQLVFESQEHEMEDPVDPLTAKIQTVVATRDAKRVSTEDNDPDALQWQHTTSHTVLTNMWVRSFDQKTWLQAWQVVQSRTRFLKRLADAWYSDRKLAKNKKAWVKTALLRQITALLDVCTEQLTRGGHPLTGGVWGAKPNGADASQWQYYNHQPTQAEDGVDPATHQIKPWKPQLDSANIEKLQNACENWIELRGQIPWTSVEAASYVTGEVNAPTKVEEAAGGVADVTAPTDDEEQTIANQILRSFDFFPAALNAKRTVTHAAGVAARHLVEHFEYHPTIQPTWRPGIKAAFMDLWKARVIADIKNEEDKTNEHERYTQDATSGRAKKRRTGSTTSKVKPPERGRDLAGLEELRDCWDDVESEFERTYTVLAAALTSRG
jgi:hypothetical protein